MPSGLREAVIEQLGKGSKNYRRALQVGFFATETCNGSLDIVDLCYFGCKSPQLFEYMLKQAESDKSKVHFVKGCTDTVRSKRARESRDEAFEDKTMDNADIYSSNKKYRGKHRSHTKGPGFKALVRGAWTKHYSGKIDDK